MAPHVGNRAGERSPRPWLTLVACACTLLLVSCGFNTERLITITTDGTDWPTYRGNLASDGDANTASAFAIDAQLWESKTGGVACGEPVVHDGYIFFPGCDRRIEVYDALTGERRFRDRFDGPVSGVTTGDSTFVFVTDQNQRQLYVYSRNPAKEVWSAKIPISPSAPRLLPDGTMLIAALHGRLIRMRPQGEIVWDVLTQGQIYAPPTLDDSVIYIPAGRVLSARRLSDGSELWSHQTSGAVMASAAVDDHVYIGSTDSLLYALDPATGRMDWFFATNGQLLTTPAIGDSLVYLAANDRRVYAIAKSNGKQVWSFDTGGPANQSPTLIGDILLVGTTTEKLLLLDARTGNLIREFELTAPAVTSPIVAHNRVFIADQNRRLHCFGPKAD